MPGSLTCLELQNFRAFRGATLKLDVDGKNLLIFGENGSGKTTIWEAMEAMLDSVLAKNEIESRALFAPHRYKWAKPEEEASVKITLAGFNRPYVWSAEETPIREDVFQAAARTRACLDYRALWETYFIQRHDERIDIWPLLVETLLPHFKPVSSGETLEKQWEPFKAFVANRQRIRSKQLPADLKSRHETFVARITRMLDEVRVTSSPILSMLSPDLTFDWTVEMNEIQQVEGTKEFWHLPQPRVWLRVSLGGREFTNHHNLLNEARLSSLAIAIYLGAAKLNESQSDAAWRLLALDDVLIGLDMSHRIPMLDVLEQHFGDWQVILTTYDRAWYELAKSRLNKDEWKKFEFYASEEIPIWSEDCGALEKSKKYLAGASDHLAPDYRAAGVWARSAFEWMMKWFCNNHGVPIAYCLDDKYLKAETLWNTLKTVEVEVLEKPGAPLVKRMLISQEIGLGVNRSKAQHLNPLCHANLEAFQSSEIGDSIKALVALEIELRGPFHSVSIPKKTIIAAERKILDFDIENLQTHEKEALFYRTGKSLGKLPK